MKKIFFTLFALMILNSQAFVADAAIARDIRCGRFGQPECVVRNQITVDAYGRSSNRYTGNTYNFLNNSVAGVYTQQVSSVVTVNNIKTYVQTKRTDKESFDAYNPVSRYHVYPRYLVRPYYNRVVTRTYVRPVYTYFY